MNGKRIPFSTADEEKIASAGVWGIIIAITSLASTAVGLAASVVGVFRTIDAVGKMGGDFPFSIGMIAWVAVPGLIVTAIWVLLSIWLLQASLAFRKVALTDVADQHYLLRGFRKLRNYFMTIGILVIIGLSFGALAFLGALTCGAMVR
jgi:hypothetical protein